MIFLKRRCLINYQSLSRCFSGHGGHPEGRKFISGERILAEGTIEDYKQNIPERMFFFDRFVAYFSKWIPVLDITYFVRNDRESKLTAYYWLGKASLYLKYFFKNS